MKVFQEVNKYPMSIINKIAEQELNYSKVKIEQQKLMKLPVEFS